MFHPERQTDIKRSGYVLLLSVLIIGVIAAVVLPSLLFLGMNAGQVSVAIGESSQALAAAQGCAEYALLKLRDAEAYTGNETLSLNQETCSIRSIGGIGNEHRLLCVQGQAGDTIRRMEIIVDQVFPQITIDSWQEVSSFTLCP